MLRIKRFDARLQLASNRYLEGRMGARTSQQIDDITGAIKPTTEIVFAPMPEYDGELPETALFISDTPGYLRCRVRVTRESPWTLILTKID